jgi:hypothetical protein
MKTAFDRVEIWEVPGLLGSEPPTLRDRLRDVTWTGNLLVCCQRIIHRNASWGFTSWENEKAVKARQL